MRGAGTTAGSWLDVRGQIPDRTGNPRALPWGERVADVVRSARTRGAGTDDGVSA